MTYKIKHTSIGNSSVSSAIWNKHARVSFQNSTSPRSLKKSRLRVFSNCTRNHAITY